MLNRADDDSRLAAAPILDIRTKGHVVNSIIATMAAADGGIIRIYRDGMVDAVDGEHYSISPGFDNVAECEAWIAEHMAHAEREQRLREASAAYARTRDGEKREHGWDGPTPEAIQVLEKLHAAHLRYDPTGVTLNHEETAVLWAEIVRRTDIPYQLQHEASR